LAFGFWPKLRLRLLTKANSNFTVPVFFFNNKKPTTSLFDGHVLEGASNKQLILMIRNLDIPVMKDLRFTVSEVNRWKLLGVVFLLITFHTDAQSYKKSAQVIYHPFYNGIQMITVDSLSNWKFQIGTLEAQYPKGLSWSMTYPSPIANPYIFRDENGEIVSQFNVFDHPFKNSDFTAPNKVENTFLCCQRGYGEIERYTYSPFVPVYRSCENGSLKNINDTYTPKKTGLIIHSENGIGLIDSLGTLLLEPLYEDIKSRDTLFLLTENNETRLTDIDFQEIISRRYTYMFFFNQGLIYVSDSSKYGFIDCTGKVICQQLYSTISYFKNGIAMVQRDGLWGFLNTEGKEIIPTIYDSVHEFDLETNTALVQKGKEFYYINVAGEKVGNYK